MIAREEALPMMILGKSLAEQYEAQFTEKNPSRDLVRIPSCTFEANHAPQEYMYSIRGLAVVIADPYSTSANRKLRNSRSSINFFNIPIGWKTAY